MSELEHGTPTSRRHDPQDYQAAPGGIRAANGARGDTLRRPRRVAQSNGRMNVVFSRMSIAFALLLLIRLFPLGATTAHAAGISVVGLGLYQPDHAVLVKDPTLDTDAVEHAFIGLGQEAVAQVDTVHGVTYDYNRTLEWASPDVRAAMWALLLQDITTPAASRTTDQAALYSWMQGLVKSANVSVATDAQNEFTKWAGNPCYYQPPAPLPKYVPDPSGCGVPLSTLLASPSSPSSQDFEKWGGADFFGPADNPTTQKTTAETTQKIIGLGAALGTTAVATALGVGLSLGITSLTDAFVLAIVPFALGIGAGAAGVAAVVAIPLLAAVAGIMQIIAVVNGNKVPGELNKAVTSAQTMSPDLGASIKTKEGLQQLYSLFLDQTSPDFTPGSPAPSLQQDAPSFNLLVSSPSTYTQTLTSKTWDGGTQSTYLDNGWFVTTPAGGTPKLSFSLNYLDWSGKQASASTAPNHQFIITDPAAQGSQVPDCSQGSQCYVDNKLLYLTDAGNIQTAQIHDNLPPVAAATVNGVAVSGASATGTFDYGSTLTFTDASSDPQGSPITSNWQFQTQCPVTQPLCFQPANATATGNSVTHNFGGVGTFKVQLDSTDAFGLTSSTTFTVTIRPVPLMVTAPTASIRYGGTFTILAPTYSGFIAGEGPQTLQPASTLASPLAPGDCAVVDSNARPLTGVLPAGTYATSCGGVKDPNYAISYTNGTLTVTPAPLTIKTDNKTIPYGTLPRDTWTGSGWVAGDSAGTLATFPNLLPTCFAILNGTNVTTTTAPGVYPNALICAGAVDPNYSITNTPGTLTIDPLLTLAEQGLPSTAPHRATLDGAAVTLPNTSVEVPYGTTHSYSFPTTVIDPSGTVYFSTNNGDFTGAVTTNRTSTVVYQTMAQIVSAALASGGINKSGLASVLTRQFDAIQSDIASGHTALALTELHTFATLVSSMTGTHITAATANVLQADAQRLYAALGGTGSLVGSPTASLVASFSVIHAAHTLLFTWRMSATRGVAGFNLYRGAQRLNGKVIRVHAGREYRYHYGATPHGSSRLQVILTGGRSVMIPAH